MTPRERLHQLVEVLPDSELVVAERVLDALQTSIDPLERTLQLAPLDDEVDDDDADGGLTEARRELAEGKLISHDEAMRILGLS